MVKPFVVRFGERLDEIAAEHGTSTRELRALNGIDDTSEVRPGLTLVVPDGRKPAPTPPCDTTIVAVPDKEDAVSGRKRVFYRTLPHGLAGARSPRSSRSSRPSWRKWNNVDLDAKLASNMVLQLWVPQDFDSSKAALVDPARVRVVTVGSPEFFDLVEGKRGRKRLTYTVKKGDDLQAHRQEVQPQGRRPRAHQPLRRRAHRARRRAEADGVRADERGREGQGRLRAHPGRPVADGQGQRIRRARSTGPPPTTTTRPRHRRARPPPTSAPAPTSVPAPTTRRADERAGSGRRDAAATPAAVRRPTVTHLNIG